MGQMGKQRIAILGGGIAGLVAAFEISDDPSWADNYDVTVYQLGWRLGGKCASGRNAEQYQRIEEHGLHILLGFYENAFRVIKQAYAELKRPPGAPLATWQDALKPQSYIVLMEQLRGGNFEPWSLPFPTNSDEPGTGGVLPTPWAIVQMIIGWLKTLLTQSARLPDDKLDTAEALATSRDHDGLFAELERVHDFVHQMEANDLEDDIDWRRIYCGFDLGVAATKGLIASGQIFKAWSKIFELDTLDFRAWLAKYGAHDVSIYSAYIDGMYDLGFSMNGQVGAGTALNGMIRLAMTYKGAVMWEMQAGMGDTIIAPLYLALKARGVKFELFQRVDDIQVANGRVSQIVIGQQVTTKGDYQPLVEVDGLPCWPSEPLYDQLVQGDALRASKENLENWWTAWQDPVPPKILVDGTDYDQVVLACSVGAFPYIAQQVIAASPPFAAMVDALKTTQTQAAQLWLSKSFVDLGWTLPKPVLDGYAEPMDTWSDMTHLLVRENWPTPPQALAYLCSPLPDCEPLPPRSDHGYPFRQLDRVKAGTLAWMTTWAGGLWPKAANENGFDWSLLVAPGSTATGPDRLDTQYWIADWNPSDRYVLAVPNSVDKRLGTRGANIANLFLAGDWLLTGMNVGCVEAATMGGMHASQAICGRPQEIIGDDTQS